MEESDGSGARHAADEILLWPDGAPGSEAWTQTERILTSPEGERRVVNVSVPTLTEFLPEPATANGTAVIIAPGGGFRMLSIESEGSWVAEWLQARGVAAYVLKYRLIDTGSTDAELQQSFLQLFEAGRVGAVNLAPEIRPLAKADAEQAVRYARRHGATTVGFIGFSAGGIITTDVAATKDLEARPDFIAPIYGASTPEPVPADAPPMFSMVCADDDLCLGWCLDAFATWRAAGRAAELHVYGEGGHGFGLHKRGVPVDSWIDRLGDWMTSHGWLGA